jgi:hypothetical protein
MIKKIIISLTIAASITAVVTLVIPVKSNGLPFSCRDNSPYIASCMADPGCSHSISYTGFPIHDKQVNQDTCNNKYSHTYSVLGIIENLIIWFVIIFSLIEGYSLVRKRLSVGKTNQSIKK